MNVDRYSLCTHNVGMLAHIILNIEEVGFLLIGIKHDQDKGKDFHSPVMQIPGLDGKRDCFASSDHIQALRGLQLKPHLSVLQLAIFGEMEHGDVNRIVTFGSTKNVPTEKHLAFDKILAQVLNNVFTRPSFSTRRLVAVTLAHFPFHLD